MDTSEIITQIITGNNDFVEHHDADYFASHATHQNPYITLVSCADSRVPANAIMPDTINKIFKIENIGNQVLSSEGSVDYGIIHLKTPVLMILGHSDCGAIKAYLKGFDEESYNIKRELDFLMPHVSTTNADISDDKILSAIIQHNIDYQVNIAYKKFRDNINSGKLTVVGAYYDFKNEFGKGYGRIIITNINRHKERDKILDMPCFQQIKGNVKEIFVDRLHY